MRFLHQEGLLPEIVLAKRTSQMLQFISNYEEAFQNIQALYTTDIQQLTVCTYCQQLLRYPHNANAIRCPKCNQIIVNPSKKNAENLSLPPIPNNFPNPFTSSPQQQQLPPPQLSSQQQQLPYQLQQQSPLSQSPSLQPPRLQTMSQDMSRGISSTRLSPLNLTQNIKISQTINPASSPIKAGSRSTLPQHFMATNFSEQQTRKSEEMNLMSNQNQQSLQFPPVAQLSSPPTPSIEQTDFPPQLPETEQKQDMSQLIIPSSHISPSSSSNININNIPSSNNILSNNIPISNILSSDIITPSNSEPQKNLEELVEPDSSQQQQQQLQQQLQQQQQQQFQQQNNSVLPPQPPPPPQLSESELTEQLPQNES